MTEPAPRKYTITLSTKELRAVELKLLLKRLKRDERFALQCQDLRYAETDESEVSHSHGRQAPR